MKTAVLILNHNGRDVLGECLDSLASQTVSAGKIVVVDNASTDGSQALVRERHPGVEMLCQGTNLGFAGGNNAGIAWIMEHLPVEYVVLLNNDTRVDPGWLASLVKAMDEDASLGSASSCMVYASNPRQVNNAGDMPLWDGAGVGRGRHAPAAEYGRDVEIFGPCAGAAIYRAEALRQAAMDGDYLDADYFAYNEDVDLSWRLRKRGWNCRYVASALVVHHHAQTMGRNSLWVLYHGERNRLWTLVKNFSWFLILFSPLYTAARYLTVLTGGARACSTAGRYFSNASAAAVAWTLCRAWGAGVLGIPRMLGKRWRHGLGFSIVEQWSIFGKYGASLRQTVSH